MNLEILLDPNLPPLVEGAVSFETGARPEDVATPSRHAYEHEGEGFSSQSPGALTKFYEDLTYGMAFPLVFASKAPRDVDTVVAALLFLDRSLVMHPSVPGFVAGVDLVHRYGPTMAGQVEEDLYRLLLLVRGHACVPGLSRRELGSRLQDAMGWVRDYLVGSCPHLGPPLPTSRVVDVGTGGFVIGESIDPSPEAWIGLYRLGFLKGVVFGTVSSGQRRVVASRKSDHIPFDLRKAQALLNEVERIEGNPPSWRMGGFFLTSSGTNIAPKEIVDVFLRC